MGTVFATDGIQELMGNLGKLADIPISVQDEMLQAQAEVVAAAQRRTAAAYGVRDTGELVRSITVGATIRTKSGRAIEITFAGDRRRFRVISRNAEIAFINEFGRKGQAGRPFIRDGVKSSESAAAQAALAVYDKHLTSQNL